MSTIKYTKYVLKMHLFFKTIYKESRKLALVYIPTFNQIYIRLTSKVFSTTFQWPKSLVRTIAL